MDLELKGKKVIISAATRGLGRRIAERFLAEGAIVSFCGRRAHAGETNPSDSEVFSNPLAGDGVAEAEAALSLGLDERAAAVVVAVTIAAAFALEHGGPVLAPFGVGVAVFA